MPRGPPAAPVSAMLSAWTAGVLPALEPGSATDRADLRFEELPGGRVEALAPARIKIAERGPEARRVGAVDDHAGLFQRLGAAGVDRLDVLALYQRAGFGIALDHGLDLAGQCRPGLRIGKQRKTRPPMPGQA